MFYGLYNDSSSSKIVETGKHFYYIISARVCEGFILEYMNTNCDRDPTGKIYRMPAGVSKIDLHLLYKSVHHDGLEKSEFYNILNTKFMYLVFSKVSSFQVRKRKVLLTSWL